MHPLLDGTRTRLQMEQRHREAADWRRARQLRRATWRTRLAAGLVRAGRRLQPLARWTGRWSPSGIRTHAWLRTPPR